MKRIFLLFKKTGLVIISSFLILISANAVAQKSIYKVIPGSGPKKSTKEGLPSINKDDNNRRDEIGAYTIRRRNLPPGQAKKIYGGAAKDYAPGQMKKRYKKDGKHKNHKKHWDKERDDDDKKEKKDHHD